MSWIMKLHRNEHTNMDFIPPVYLQNYDVDAKGGWGEIATTHDLTQALRFSTKEEAFDAYYMESNVMPIRPDGKPNRPLTAFTVEVTELLEDRG